jgi:hypothetical protein
MRLSSSFCAQSQNPQMLALGNCDSLCMRRTIKKVAA